MKYKVILRDDSVGNTITYTEAIIETTETIEELKRHAHIVTVIEEIVEKKSKEIVKE